MSHFVTGVKSEKVCGLIDYSLEKVCGLVVYSSEKVCSLVVYSSEKVCGLIDYSSEKVYICNNISLFHASLQRARLDDKRSSICKHDWNVSSGFMLLLDTMSSISQYFFSLFVDSYINRYFCRNNHINIIYRIWRMDVLRSRYACRLMS